MLGKRHDSCTEGRGFYQENPTIRAQILPSFNDRPCMVDMSYRLKAIEADLKKSIVEKEEKAFSASLASTEPSLMCSNNQEGPVEELSGLSAEEVIRVAAANFIQMSGGDHSKLRYPLRLFSCLTPEELKNVGLVSILLSAAEKISIKQYDLARKLLRQCSNISLRSGDPVQRLVFYFTNGLQERIDRDTQDTQGSSSQRKMERNVPAKASLGSCLSGMREHLYLHEKVPFPKLVQFTSIQTIIDNVSTAKRIHVIDLSIRYGLQWTILMQALSQRTSRPISYLKISAVGISEEMIATTGKRLASFAETLQLPFDFTPVLVTDMMNLREDMFEVEDREVIVVYSSMVINSMIVKPESMDCLMRVLMKLKPHMISVADVEGDHNSPYFVNRFTEALFYYSALFDCIESCTSREDKDRMAVERSIYTQGIKSMVASEGEERVVRHVGISVWRLFFARFGLMEVEQNEWSPYQGSLLVKQFLHGSSCTIDKDGKSLLIRWKGTPLFFVAAWKFPRYKKGKKASKDMA